MASTTTSLTKTISFFGATGGCTAACLAHTLKNGFEAVALARTPAKLIKAMLSGGVSHKQLDSNLRIVQGDIADVEAVRQTLLTDDKVSETIICGTGGEPLLQFSLLEPIGTTDAVICEKSIKSILKAVDFIGSSYSPVLTMISSAGVSTTYRDWPLLMVVFYRWMLLPMFRDKRRAHELLVKRQDCRFISVRPSHLTEGASKGMPEIREGLDDKPAVGYSISKEDVGLWMFERIVRAEPAVVDTYVRKNVNITY